MLTYPAPTALCGVTLQKEIEQGLSLPAGSVSVVAVGPDVQVAGPADTAATQVGQIVAAHTGTLPVDQQNGATLRQRALTALTANATYLAIATPTNAQIRDQVATLTKECNGLIRLLLNQLDTTSGT